ncbi:hypothetical protein TrRE_jg7920 [Triparma retinervis]|uniref:Uncharacterized protein n=1 Tax=Triparma retinervis TaxID=2557542 RepID=A0A9W6Z8W8_9STRA|nr:hypothetical protein TrRE_jg7920 [Triparma retinervis]
MDGSAQTRALELSKSTPPSPSPPSSPSSPSSPPSQPLPSYATFSRRYSTSPLSLKYVDLLKSTSRCTETLLPAPPSTRPLTVQFDFPSDWLQLDRMSGGLHFVDQRNGDKLYVLRASLPPGSSLVTVPVSWFARAIFDAEGGVARAGNAVEDPRAASSRVVEDGTESLPRRRVQLKYATVTSNGYRVERRGTAECYEVGGGEVQILMVGQKATAKEGERETAEKIVNSWRVEV